MTECHRCGCPCENADSIMLHGELVYFCVGCKQQLLEAAALWLEAFDAIGRAFDCAAKAVREFTEAAKDHDA